MSSLIPAEPRNKGRSKLKIRPIKLDTMGENVVILARDCSALRPDRLAGFRKVDVQVNGGRIVANVLIADGIENLAANEIGLPQPALRRLGVKPGDDAYVSIAPPAASLDAVRAKIRGEELTREEIKAVVEDLAQHRYSDMEVAAFLIATSSFMTTSEVLALTSCMASAGTQLKWDHPVIVDKHCIGGIPGNRTTMILTPIVAAHGLTMPKTSSRAITSPSGTADTMEVLARVELTVDEMRDVVDRCNGCIVWGGHVNLSPADDVLISVERPLSIDTPEQMVASILSKKIAAGSTHLLIDMPMGPTAKIRSHIHAQSVRKLFEFVASRLGLTTQVLVTDGSQPVGRGIGPALEARDVLSVLENRPDAPSDLREKSIRLAGCLLERDPDLQGGNGEQRARELLNSGAARKALDRMIEAQGPPPRAAPIGPLVFEAMAGRDGIVNEIDCFRIARIARTAGAPSDAGAGIDLLKKAGDVVRKGEPLYRLHGFDPSDFAAARSAAEESSGFEIGSAGR
ncbi:putative thymidine phosphorylase [uncultured Defluviicoccus sp.]|uniref:Putative thymidine phosphorylase n=1 Tax=metagenome TaxID=256318 RepID=A0A380T9D4_9ZZZZ|nr:putative thymidine phosphorylase [uncultured Defluviicoccus sp.]